MTCVAADFYWEAPPDARLSTAKGLQHEDGHSHLAASTIPNCVSYDPTFAYELAVIIQDGLRRMYEAQEDVYYYITVMNENYSHPEMPANAEQGILKGMYLFRESSAGSSSGLRVQLLGSGTILREVIAAAELLEKEYDVAADIWSATSFNELRREALDVTRWNMLHPDETPRLTYVGTCLKDREGPGRGSYRLYENFCRSDTGIRAGAL